MEEGQKQNISLSSGIDVKSSDMLVPVTEPLFQHNRQQFQGKYLPSSVRFEHDGWAIGNGLYNFEFYNKDFKTQSGSFYAVKKKLNDNPAYVIIFQKEIDLGNRVNIAQVYWNAISSATNGVNVEQDNHIAVFSGEFNGMNYTLRVNPIDDTFTISDSSEFDAIIIKQKDGSRSIDILDIDSRLTFSFEFLPASDIYDSDLLFAKIRNIEDSKYNFENRDGDTVFYNKDTNVLVWNEDVFPCNNIDGTCSVQVNKSIGLDLRVNTSIDNWIAALSNPSVSSFSLDPHDTDFKLGGAYNKPFDKYSVSSSLSDGTQLTPNNKLFISGWLPEWHTLHIHARYTGDHGSVVNNTSSSQTVIIERNGTKFRGRVTISVHATGGHYGWTVYSRPVYTVDSAEYDNESIDILGSHTGGLSVSIEDSQTGNVVCGASLSGYPIKNSDYSGYGGQSSSHCSFSVTGISSTQEEIDAGINYQPLTSDMLEFGSVSVSYGSFSTSKGNISISSPDRTTNLILSCYSSNFRPDDVQLSDVLTSSINCSCKRNSNDLDLYSACAVKGYFDYELSFVDKMTESNSIQKMTFVPRESPTVPVSGHHYIDRGENAVLSLSIGRLLSDYATVQINVDENFNLYASEYKYGATNLEDEPDAYLPFVGYDENGKVISEGLTEAINPAFKLNYTRIDINEYKNDEILTALQRKSSVDNVFFNTVFQSWLENAHTDISALAFVRTNTYTSATQTISVYIKDTRLFYLRYNCITGECNVTKYLPATIDDYAIQINRVKVIDEETGEETDEEVDDITTGNFISFGLLIPYTFNFIFDTAVSNEGTLISYEDNEYAFDYLGTQFKVNTLDKVLKIRKDTFNMLKIGSKYIADIDTFDKISFSAIVKGPFGEHNILSFDDDFLYIQDDSLKYSELLDFKNELKFVYTDIEKEDLSYLEVDAIDPDEEFQFLKQQWCSTTEIEGFWWIDSEHILLLDSYKFILRKKTSELHDWNGDVFEDEDSWRRAMILTPDVLSFGATSAFDGVTALLYTVSMKNNTCITIRFYDPLNDMQLNEIEVYISKKNLGEVLNSSNDSLNTYSEITATSLVGSSKFSSTCIGNHILFGIHYTNNFDQWALKINRETFDYSVLQGYGFVGVNGCLTGGEIPTAYFSNSLGFNDIVHPLDILNAEDKFVNTLDDIYAIDIGEKVVGTEKQQWYICKKLNSIVSHLEWVDNEWVIRELPITNNLAQRYSSGSFGLYKLSDFLIQPKSIDEMFPRTNISDPNMSTISKLLKTALVIVGYPLIYLWFPKILTFLELQQTFGQAAYVHRNNTSVHQSKDLNNENDTHSENDMGDYWKEGEFTGEDKLLSEMKPISRDEVCFNTHIIKQTVGIVNFYNLLISLLMPGLVSKSSSINEVKIESHKNKTSTEDGGKQYSTYYTKVIDASASTENVLQGLSSSVASAVVGTLTLDMFYSTSDKQEISAGPGWVNHNFVAQCVSSSVTAHHMEVLQTGLSFIIKALTMAQIDLTIFGVELLADGLHKLASITENSTVFGTNVGVVIATGIHAAALIAEADLAAMKAARVAMSDILDALGAGEIKANTVLSKSTHTVDPETKHAYGNKSECFMWPCFGAGEQEIPDETVDIVNVDNKWEAIIPTMDFYGRPVVADIGSPEVNGVVTNRTDDINNKLKGDVHYYVANVKGNVTHRKLPKNMAYVIGASSILSSTPFRNENVGVGEPVFPTHPFQDYIIDDRWQLGHTASVGMTTWISCKDTKIIDGELSNVVVSDTFCGVASSYTAIEIKRGIDQKYIRPYAITPNALTLNNTGKNCCYNEKVYHAFDGYGYRIINWMGSPGMDKAHQTWLYSFLVNDRFKRSNKLPLNEYLGNFVSEPVQSIAGDENDHLFTLVTQPNENVNLQSGTIGEDKSVRRYAIPVFTEYVQTLPASVKTVSSINLSVIDGVTTLTTNNRDLQSAYKAPVSVDFAIGKSLYRYTQEYICNLRQEKGITVVEETVPCLGLTFLGATPQEAYLYSKATRQYYTFTGGTSLQMIDMVERFRNVVNGFYDFINQEVVVPCLATFLRLDKNVHDDENETDNVIVLRLKNNSFVGELTPPIENIYNTRSWYRVLSLPSGIAYQGPNRCIINRSIAQEYMYKQIKDNYGKWKRVPRENYHPFREYKAKYEYVDRQIGNEVEVKGWTHNPFLLVTAPIGVSEQTDCLFEWEITFCWPIEMDKLYGINNYAVVNIQAETMTPGGKVIAARPTHVFLKKDLFTRTGNYGYYSFKYKSDCGAGNRERLHIWSDQFICVSSLQCEYKQITSKRNEILTQQIDVSSMDEI